MRKCNLLKNLAENKFKQKNENHVTDVEHSWNRTLMIIELVQNLPSAGLVFILRL